MIVKYGACETTLGKEGEGYKNIGVSVLWLLQGVS